MTAGRPLGRILTFYSYKGGTGRSMAVANVAWIMAGCGRRVLIIDWDLEAPGLHRYFLPFLIDKELTASHGLIDLVDNYANQAIQPLAPGAPVDPEWYLPYTDFSDYLVSINFDGFAKGGKIDLLPAGRQDDRYALTVSSFNWQNFYDRLGGGGFFEAVKAQARANYDYILIDSRTGVSDTAGICSVQMPDTLVVCFTYNNQSIKGAAAVARSAIGQRAKLVDEQRELRLATNIRPSAATLEDTPPPYRVFPVPMRVDRDDIDRLAIRQAFAREAFADLLTHLGPAEANVFWSTVEVPYLPFYSYEEVLAPFKENAHDPKTVLAAILRLTQYLSDGDIQDYRFPIAPAEKQRWLEAFGETPALQPVGVAPGQTTSETPEEALARRADAALAALDEEERAIARRVMCRLVRLGREEEGGGLYPIRVNFNEFGADEREIVATLATHGLLKVADDTRSTVLRTPSTSERSVSLADERLLDAWATLSQWVEGDREFLLWRQQMRAYLADWERSGRDADALLSGRLLYEADGWMLRRGGDLNALEVEYVNASRRGQLHLETAARARTFPSAAQSPPPAASRSAIWWTAAGAMVGTALFAAVYSYSLMRPSDTASPSVPTNVTPTTTDAPKSSTAPAQVDDPTLAIKPAPSATRPTSDTTALEAVLKRGEELLDVRDFARAHEAFSNAVRIDATNQRAIDGLLAARQALQSAASASGRVLLHYDDAADKARVGRVREAIARALAPAEVPAPELIRSDETGNVRFFFPEDQSLAERAKTATETTLTEIGHPVTLVNWARDARSFPNARRGTIEVWLPPLVARLYVTTGDREAATRLQSRLTPLSGRALEIIVRPDAVCQATSFGYVFREDASEAQNLAVDLAKLGIKVPRPILRKAGNERRRHFDLCLSVQAR